MLSILATISVVLAPSPDFGSPEGAPCCGSQYGCLAPFDGGAVGYRPRIAEPKGRFTTVTGTDRGMTWRLSQCPIQSLQRVRPWLRRRLHARQCGAGDGRRFPCRRRCLRQPTP